MRLNKLFLMLLVLAVVLASCQSGKEREKNSTRNDIEKALENEKASLPMRVQGFGSVDDMCLEDDYMVVSCTIDDVSNEFIDINDIEMNKDDMARRFAFAINQQPKSKEILKLLQKAELGIKCKYKSMKTGRVIEAVIEADELQEAANGSSSDDARTADEIIRDEINSVKKKLPMMADEMTTMTDATYDGKVVVMSYKVNESAVDMDIIKANISEARANLLESFKNERMLQMLLGAMEKNNVSLRYVYVGSDSGKSITLEFTPEELKRAI